MNVIQFADHKFTDFPSMAVASSGLPFDADDDWAQFLGLGMRAAGSDLQAGAPWARAPVLLSY